VSTHASSICCAAGFGEFGENPLTLCFTLDDAVAS